MSDAKLSALLAPPSPAGLPAPRLDRPAAALRQNKHWVFAAVRAVAQEAAATPLAFFVRRGRRPEWPRLEDLAPRHPALALFSRSPRELLSLTVAFLELTGDAYWYLPKNALGRPARVVVAHSQFMRVAASGYEYRRGGRTISFAPDEIVYLRYPDPASDFYGRSPLAAAADQVAAFSAMKTAQRRSFENGVFPGLALTVRDALGKEQTDALRNDLARLYARPERAGRTLVLSGDVSAQPITLSPREMDFIESGRAGRDEILSAFGVPDARRGLRPHARRGHGDGPPEPLHALERVHRSRGRVLRLSAALRHGTHRARAERAGVAPGVRALPGRHRGAADRSRPHGKRDGPRHGALPRRSAARAEGGATHPRALHLETNGRATARDPREGEPEMAASTDLTTLAKAKLDIGDADADETLLAALIDAASEMIENHTGRRFAQTAVTEYHDGRGERFLLLDRPPVDAGQTFQVWDDTGRAYGSGSLLDADRYTVDAEAGVVRLDSGAFADGKADDEAAS